MSTKRIETRPRISLSEYAMNRLLRIAVKEHRSFTALIARAAEEIARRGHSDDPGEVEGKI